MSLINLKKIILVLITLFLFSCSKPALEIEKDTEKAKTIINECISNSKNAIDIKDNSFVETDYLKSVKNFQKQIKDCFKSKGYDFTKTLEKSLDIKKIENFKYANSLISAYRESRKHGIKDNLLWNTVYSIKEIEYIEKIYKAQQNFGTWNEETPDEEYFYYLTDNKSLKSEGYDLKLTTKDKNTNGFIQMTGNYFFDGDKLIMNIDKTFIFGMNLPIALERIYSYKKIDNSLIEIKLEEINSKNKNIVSKKLSEKLSIHKIKRIK